MPSVVRVYTAWEQCVLHGRAHKLDGSRYSYALCGKNMQTMNKDCMCVRRWSFITGQMQPAGAEDKIRKAGVLLFHNLFELDPRLRKLFPFKTGTGHIADKVP